MAAVDLTAFPMVPDEEGSTPEEDLAAAVASQLDVPPAAVPLSDEEPVPIGWTWNFDFETGQFVRVGGSPVPVAGATTVAQWCLMAIHTARGQYAAFGEDFGMENPGDVIGEFAEGEVVADFEADLEEALLVHDRITSVENIALDWDSTDGILTIEEMDVVTDEGEALPILGVQVGGI